MLTVYFTKPQPKGIKSLKDIPLSYRGKYIFMFDTLVIKTKSFIYPDVLEERAIPISSIDSLKGIKIRDDLIYDAEFDSTQGLSYYLKNDTLYYKLVNNHVLYLSDTIVLKYYKNLFFLNIENVEGLWDVLIFEPKDNDLILKSTYSIQFDSNNNIIEIKFTDKDKIDILTDLGYSYSSITNSFYLNPSKKELLKLIDKGIFKDIIKLRKIE